ncbi:MAG: nucleotidyltransferase [bacterium]
MCGGNDMASIIVELIRYANQLYISNDSPERSKINRSFVNFHGNLRRHFGKSLSAMKRFGSYTRGTILPRKYDSRSDIDVLIIFNQDIFGRTPETYRNNLLSFASKCYQSSSIRKDFPTVVVELNHIKFDLVPAKIEEYLFGFRTMFIPDLENNWQTTDPVGFNQKLTTANRRYKSIVKPIIRLLKYWNATHNYPYESFSLEQEIADMNFSGDNLQSGFFRAIRNLDTFFVSNTIANAVDSLRKNAENVAYYLSINNKQKALLWLNHILPRF